MGEKSTIRVVVVQGLNDGFVWEEKEEEEEGEGNKKDYR